MTHPPDVRRSVAELFDRSARTYDAVGVDFFPVFARHLLDDAGIAAGDRVLDVGCGRGAVLFPAAERVGPGGSVHGIDLSSGMIERTGRDAAGIDAVTVEVMDGQEPTLAPSSFDVVLAAAVVFFLPDPAAGLRAWLDLLVPGGRLGITTFGGSDPRWATLQALFGPFVPPEMIWKMIDPASPFASSENLAATLTAAGFTDVESVVRRHPITYADPQQWVDWSLSHGQRVFWELVPDDRRAEVEAAVLTELERLREPDGRIVMIQTVRYTTARRPWEPILRTSSAGSSANAVHTRGSGSGPS